MSPNDVSTGGTAVASKQCTVNGTWWRENLTNQEWTDYTTCVHLQGFKTLYYVGVSCNIFSLALLLPACVVFVLYRQLRTQHRIQIHLNLFLSCVMTNVLMVLWEHLVYNDRIENPTESGPLLPVLIYAAIRAVRGDKGCWVQNAGSFEWLVYVPNLLCILVNVFFLLGILKILLTQLQSHPNEPSSYRRALKATFVLVPLFGLQLFLVVYRPITDSFWTQMYEIFAKVITNTQGAVVALLFCFFNGEVSERWNTD
ncbi:calcitonin gene-related peptide type 1 receptor-like [Haliotis rubra]|uniref:calcitonin gene-related peptide type 1 receptor-like n=1 Tax=Haliotis rubra TaxID=36100 RepID=UPI001EE5085B|nr:calcitonin gene-related peptide type 1 receptor-like [Haliotis rubra]